MELKYGDSKTYLHELAKEDLDYLVSKTNRSVSQTKFLFQLVDGDLEQLKKLEMNLRNAGCSYSPGDKESADFVLSLNPVNKSLVL